MHPNANCNCRAFSPHPARKRATFPQGEGFPAVGAGQAPPATVCYNEYYGYSVGTATMPPVAAARILRYNG